MANFQSQAEAVERIVRHAGKIQLDDLDWTAAARVGLTDTEAFIVTYFSDVESQTLANLRTLLGLRGSLDPEMVAFLTTWNYEEYFHGRAFTRLLRESGRALPDSRVQDCHQSASFKERLERVLMPIASYAFAREFPAVYMTFGAIHELTTLRGYERLEQSANNPLLRVLSERIAKQERRHFAFYFNQAHKKLAESRRARWLTRLLLRYYFAPVGAGLKSRHVCDDLFRSLFPGSLGVALCADVDARIGRLPGLLDANPLTHYFTKTTSLVADTQLQSSQECPSPLGVGADAQ